MSEHLRAQWRSTAAAKSTGLSSRRASVADDPQRWHYLQQNWEQRPPAIEKVKKDRGYILHAEPKNPDGDREIHATTPDNEYVGSTYFGDHPDHPGRLEGAPQVRPDHRRRGLGTAMYDFAEELHGKPMAPATSHTDDAAAFWRSRH